MFRKRKPANRHLVDVRQVRVLPACEVIAGVNVVAPADLIALKVISHTARREQPKGTTDLADLQRLLLAFPALKEANGEVRARLESSDATEAALTRWNELVEAVLVPDDDQGW